MTMRLRFPRIPLPRCAARSTVLAFAAALAAGCGGPASFVDPEADLGFYETVAVLPFETVASDRLAGEKVSSVIFTELLAKDVARVTDPGQVVSAMTRVRGGTPPGRPWSTAELAKLAEELRVQGLFQGTVRDYEMARTGRDAYPLISLEMRLVDGATGRVVWSWSGTRRGGPSFPLWSWRDVHTLGELTAKMCRDALGTLK